MLLIPTWTNISEHLHFPNCCSNLHRFSVSEKLKCRTNEQVEILTTRNWRCFSHVQQTRNFRKVWSNTDSVLYFASTFCPDSRSWTSWTRLESGDCAALHAFFFFLCFVSLSCCRMSPWPTTLSSVDTWLSSPLRQQHSALLPAVQFCPNDVSAAIVAQFVPALPFVQTKAA